MIEKNIISMATIRFWTKRKKTSDIVEEIINRKSSRINIYKKLGISWPRMTRSPAKSTQLPTWIVCKPSDSIVTVDSFVKTKEPIKIWLIIKRRIKIENRNKREKNL